MLESENGRYRGQGRPPREGDMSKNLMEARVTSRQTGGEGKARWKVIQAEDQPVQRP